MKIHGLRIYPQSVEIVRGDGPPIFVHGRVSEDCSDFFYAFRPLEDLLRGHFVAETFSISHDTEKKDPMPELREQYGQGIVAADVDSQVMLLKGDDFAKWGPLMYFCEGAFLPIFRTPPTFDLLERLYWERDFDLTSDTWPAGMRAVLHMWDDIYWQFFTTEPADLDILIRAHAGDPKLKMYRVDFDREYPDPSNQELQVAEPTDTACG